MAEVFKDNQGNLITPYTTTGFTQKQKILKLLLDARLANKPRIWIDGGQGNQIIRSGGYLAMFDFDHVCSARDVRLRDLRRDHQLPISDPPHKFENTSYYTPKGEKKSFSTPVYRIELTPAEIRNLDWSRFWEIPFAAIYNRHTMIINDDSEYETDAAGQLGFFKQANHE